VSADASVREAVRRQGLVAARYCDAAGRVGAGWPVNPNGAWESAAALRSVAGNVVAIMPHPERANWAWQVPPDVGGAWAEAKRRGGRDAPGPGRVFFERFAGQLRRAAA
jgi:phosphoribosylformylglycinamidine synthase